MKAHALALSLVIISAVSGCSWTGSLAGSVTVERGRVFEDGNLKVALRLVEDRVFDVSIANKTGKVMRVFWCNSSVVCAAEDELLLTSVAPEGEGTRISEIPAGDVLDASVFPTEYAYTDGQGIRGHYPLYFSAPGGGGDPEDLAGGKLGVNLVVEVNGRMKIYPLMMDVRSEEV